MQPIVRPARPAISAVSYTALVKALLSMVGTYCSFCEKRLITSAYLFHKRAGVLQKDTTLSLDDWEFLLLVCGDCRDNFTAFNKSDYLWPDSPELARSNPFRYVRKDNVIFEVVNEATRAILQSSTQSFIFVEVAPDADSRISQAAQNTIELFQLNSKYYNNDTQAPRITLPSNDFYEGYDLRMDLRYDAYLRAMEAIETLKLALPTLQISRAFMDPMLAQVKMLLEGTGFISTWLAAFNEGLDAAGLAAIFALPHRSFSLADLYSKVEEMDVELPPEEEVEPPSGSGGTPPVPDDKGTPPPGQQTPPPDTGDEPPTKKQKT